MTGAANLSYRMLFESPTLAVSETGGQQGGWTSEFTTWAAVRWLRGGETVIAARLSGRQPAVVTVRRSVDSERITTDWRAVDALAGTVFAVRAVVPTDDRRFMEITVEAGAPS